MRNCFIILAILISLLMHACATTNVVTTAIPGKELSRTSLGVREIDNKVMMEEIDPLSVKLYRQISTVEYTKSVFQAVNETRHEKTTYDCRNAYDRYPAFLLTTMGVPLLYEMATGFDLLRKMCDKNPPTYIIETADTDKTLTRESFDKDTIVTKTTPIAGEPVVVEFAGIKYVASTTKAGIATLPESELPDLQKIEHIPSIDYQYNEVRLSTQFKKHEPQKESIPPSLSASIVKAFSDALSAPVETDLAYNPPPFYISALSPSLPETNDMTGVRRNNESSVDETRKETVQITPDSTVVADKSSTAAAKEASVPIGSVSTPESPKPIGLKLTLTVNFDRNKTSIRKEYFSRLKEIGDALKKNPGLKGVIEGHSDNAGSKELNRKVSILRAEAVAQYLIKTFGISPDRFIIEGYGISRPIADNATPKGRALNRRVEATF